MEEVVPMPRFMFRTVAHSASDVGAALAVAATRYPEISVEHRYRRRDGGWHDVWICTAPSAAHVERWTRAVSLGARGVQQVDDLPTTPAGTRRDHTDPEPPATDPTIGGGQA